MNPIYQERDRAPHREGAGVFSFVIANAYYTMMIVGEEGITANFRTDKA